MTKSSKNKGLGRGLSALMSDIQPSTGAATPTPRSADQKVPIEKVRANPNQPRRSFDEEKLQELANSIREKGVIQPIIVRKDPIDS